MAEAEIAPLNCSPGAKVVPNSYIVVFKESSSDAEVKSSLEGVKDLVTSAGGINTVNHEYNINNSFRGFSALLDDDILAKVRALSSVNYVECNLTAHVT